MTKSNLQKTKWTKFSTIRLLQIPAPHLNEIHTNFRRSNNPVTSRQTDRPVHFTRSVQSSKERPSRPCELNCLGSPHQRLHCSRTPDGRWQLSPPAPPRTQLSQCPGSTYTLRRRFLKRSRINLMFYKKNWNPKSHSANTLTIDYVPVRRAYNTFKNFSTL